MTNHKEHMGQKNTRERTRQDYKEKLARHRLSRLYRMGVLAFCFLLFVLAFALQFGRHVYTSYDVMDSIPVDKVAGTVDVPLGEGILTYSKDGAHYNTMKGEEIWNQTYEMQEVILSNCKDVAALGAYNGRTIYLANTKEIMGTVSTNMPIRNLTVSQTGLVTAILTDAEVTWINTYNKKGELLYKGQAAMDASGYPLSISLSPSGELLCVSYLYVDAGVIKTNVVFYNFGEIGANYNDHLTGGFIYNDVMVPYVQFMDDETCFAVGDGRLVLYKGAHAPEELATYLYDGEVQSVFYNEEYVGLVFISDDVNTKYEMIAYDKSGKQVGNYRFDIEYTDMFFTSNGFVAYNETECLIMTMRGREKFNGQFNRPVNFMCPANGAYRYTLVTDDGIEIIQLK